MKKVEELQTEDFISSAKTNRDVFLDHSTLIKIENQEKSPNVTLTFSVGKDNIEVRMWILDFLELDQNRQSKNRKTTCHYQIKCNVLSDSP